MIISICDLDNISKNNYSTSQQILITLIVIRPNIAPDKRNTCNNICYISNLHYKEMQNLQKFWIYIGNIYSESVQYCPNIRYCVNILCQYFLQWLNYSQAIISTKLNIASILNNIDPIRFLLKILFKNIWCRLIFLWILSLFQRVFSLINTCGNSVICKNQGIIITVWQSYRFSVFSKKLSKFSFKLIFTVVTYIIHFIHLKHHTYLYMLRLWPFSEYPLDRTNELVFSNDAYWRSILYLKFQFWRIITSKSFFKNNVDETRLKKNNQNV